MRRRTGTWLLLGLAAVLLLGSAVGSTRAALTYYSENYVAEITVSQIGVSLLENGEVVCSRDYDNSEWRVSSNGSGANGVLLSRMLEPEEKLALNKKYEERLAVRNSGSIDTYVRVRIYRYWMKDGRKLTTLAPDLIDLHFINEDLWVKNPNETAECTELFYRNILRSGEETEALTDTIRIDGSLANEARVETNGNTITTVYKYDGVEFHVDVEVDAVQTHNAADAIRSAWGVEASDLGILQGGQGE